MRIFNRIAASLGIKQRLLILVLLAVAPLTALIVWDAADDRRATIEQAGATALQSARMAALRQSGILNEAITLTENMRSIPTITVAGGDACRAQLDRLEAMHPSLDTIGVLRADGIIVCHTLLNEPKKVSLQGILDETLREGAPDVYVSHFLHGPVTGRPVIFVARPLRSLSGAKLGIVYVSIDLEAFSQLADRITGQDHRVMVVIEPETGIVLARSATSGVQLGSVFPDAGLVSAMRAHPGGGHIVGSLDGAREIFGFAPLPGAESSGAMVAVGVRTLRRPLHRQPADPRQLCPRARRHRLGRLQRLAARLLQSGAARQTARRRRRAHRRRRSERPRRAGDVAGPGVPPPRRHARRDGRTRAAHQPGIQGERGALQAARREHRRPRDPRRCRRPAHLRLAGQSGAPWVCAAGAHRRRSDRSRPPARPPAARHDARNAAARRRDHRRCNIGRGARMGRTCGSRSPAARSAAASA